MEDFLQKLTLLLEKHFPGCEHEIEMAGPNRIGGFLIWEGFSELEQIERQRVVWRLLRTELSSNEQRMISAILTLTPEEMASARNG